MRIAPLLMGAIAFFPAVSAKADGFFSGNDWANACYNRAYGPLSGYLAGVSDAIDLGPGIDIKKAAFCVPPGVKAEQLDDVFCAYIEAHPERRQFSAASLATVAFRLSFPCSGSAN